MAAPRFLSYVVHRRMSPLRHTLLVAGLAVVCLLAGAPARALDTQLPNMGSSAGAIASPEEQRQYGFYVLHEMRNQSMVLDDALLTDYLNTLGYRLVAYSPMPNQAFTFFVVRDNGINAFALPGGFVGVNAGLITTTTTESELAAVLAHEISHVTQQHLVRAVEAEQKYAPLMVLAMVGAIVAASHQGAGSTSNADVGAIATAQGLMQQMQINFTRADESEADRIGIQTLARANFDPDAMAGFFERMQHALRPGFDENDVPAMLMDHPVTLQRISEAKARAVAAKKEELQRSAVVTATPTPTPLLTLPPGAAMNSSAVTAALARPSESSEQQRARAENYYELMRERTRVLASERPTQTLAYYQRNASDGMADKYGEVLALERAGETAKAREAAIKLTSAHPGQLVLQLALGHTELMSGARDAAIKRYAELEAEYPGNRALMLAHAEALLHGGDKASAKVAQELLRPQITDAEEDPDLYTVFGRACELAGDPVRAGESHAAAAYLNGRAEDALNQLKDLSKRRELDYYQRARIDARIAEMTPIVLELRRRKIKPSDQGKLALDPKPVSACRTDTCAALSF